MRPRFQNSVTGLILGTLVAAPLLATAPPGVHRTAPLTPLSLSMRRAAQEQIERVYDRHRIWPKENTGPKPSFENAVSQTRLQAVVVDSLRKSAALERLWHRPLTPQMLQAEMERIARHTQAPATLREVFDALNHDPLLLAETLARSTLADRLIRRYYARDVRLHTAVRVRAETLLERAGREDWTTLSREAAVTREQTVFVLEKGDPSTENPAMTTSAGNHEISLSPEEFAARVTISPRLNGTTALRETDTGFLIERTLESTADRLLIDALFVPKQDC